jgi:hypothetical protein
MGLGDIFSSIKSSILTIGAGFLTGTKKLLQSHSRLVVVFLGALGIILCLLVVLGVVIHNRRIPPSAAPSPPLSEVFKPLPIPPEELFMPGEPDFLPEVLLEREPRESWTADDALPFWTDPLKENRRVWQGRVEGMIDELLERLP